MTLAVCAALCDEGDTCKEAMAGHGVTEGREDAVKESSVGKRDKKK